MSNSDKSSNTFDTAAEYSLALDRICALATRTLFIFEQDFVNLGFNDIERTRILREFLLANPQNEFKLLAHEPRHLLSSCPRLMTLFRQFGHNMHIFQTPRHLKHLTEAFAVADAKHYLRRFHISGNRGILGLDETENAAQLKSRFLEMWEESQPSPNTGNFVL